MIALRGKHIDEECRPTLLLLPAPVGYPPREATDDRHECA
jgi:hypothetical protein